MPDGTQEAPAALHTHETGNTEHLRSDLAVYEARLHSYPAAFLAQYKKDNLKEYQDLDAILGKWGKSQESTVAIAKLSDALDTYMSNLAEGMPERITPFRRYYSVDFWLAVQKSSEGNLIDLDQQLKATPPDTTRLNAALAVFDEKYKDYVMKLPTDSLVSMGKEYAKKAFGEDLPRSFWDLYSTQYRGNLQDLVISYHCQPTGFMSVAAGQHLRDIAGPFLSGKISETYAVLDTVARAQKQAVLDGFVKGNDIGSLIAAYYDVYAEEVAPEPSASATTITAAPAQKPAAEVSSSAPAEVAVDVRADAKANPEKYMTGDKNSFVFKAEKGSDADLHVRIEDIYALDADHGRVLTSSNPKLAGMEFKYDAGRGSFYQSNPDGTFTDQRLVIRGGDTISTKPVEAAPLVADAQAPAAAVDAEATVDAPAANSHPAETQIDYDPTHALNVEQQGVVLAQARGLSVDSARLEAERSRLEALSTDQRLPKDERERATTQLAQADQRLAETYQELNTALAKIDKGIPADQALAIKQTNRLDKAHDAAVAFASRESAPSAVVVQNGDTPSTPAADVPTGSTDVPATPNNVG